ncbi:WYL domain-containing protein [Marinomonas algicola]|uniref:WYL domain-containing protein n=1 Tax=Marinomonas algicola TaxID=2773454 RepID=UPI00174B6959|nr:WYL domain-containing protein [Marinomonas algicola]
MKDQSQRFIFIEHIVGWEGQINSTHIKDEFRLTRQAASSILKAYCQHFPSYLSYDASSKAFIATADFDRYFLANTVKQSFEHYLATITAEASTQIEETSLFFHEVEAPFRNINPVLVRPILRAIREKLAIDIGYISLSSPDYLDRIIQPHSLIFDGLRWHVRAYCNKNQDYRDFTLSRFNGEATFEGKATHLIAQDDNWNTLIEVTIEADSRFSEPQRRIIEQDFQMDNGQKTIPVRAALVNYLLRRLRIDSHKKSPEKQQIVLTQACRQQISNYIVD